MIHMRRIDNRLRLTATHIRTHTREQPCGFPCCTPLSILTSDHVLVPTASYLLHSLPDKPLLVLQSTLRELRTKSVARYRVIRSLKDKVFVFLNDFHPQTTLGESDVIVGTSPYRVLEDKALAFYRTHVPTKTFERIDCRDAQPVYQAYWENLEFEFVRGRIMRGCMYTDKHGSDHGVVVTGDRKILVDGTWDMNRSLNGDTVYVEMKKCMSENASLRMDTVPDDMDVDSASVEKGDVPSLLYGRVVGIYNRRHPELVGTVATESIAGVGPQVVSVVPMDKRYPAVSVETSDADELRGKRVTFNIMRWDSDSMSPWGQYARTLGVVGEKECEIKSLLLSCGIVQESTYFRPSMFGMAHGMADAIVDTHMGELQDAVNRARGGVMGDEFTAEQTEHVSVIFYKHFSASIDVDRRTDLRNQLVFSIDPPLSTDIDDALHVVTTKTGYEVGIHIADVSHFVKKDSLIDAEARKRGTTVYMRDRRIEMLPGFLSGDLCSLRSGVDRCTMSVIVDLDHEFNVQGATVKRCVVKSKFSFTYEQAQRILDGAASATPKQPPYECRYCKASTDGSDSSDITQTCTRSSVCTCVNKNYEDAPSKLKSQTKDSLCTLATIAGELRKRRFEGGAIDLSTTQMLATNHLIEEYMLLANTCVARILLRSGRPALIRVHPEITNESINNLKDLSVDFKDLNNSMSGKVLEKIIITRHMTQATYRCSESVTAYRHYGLAAAEYTHFTSPIRRYADVVVHRILGEMLEKGDVHLGGPDEGVLTSTNLAEEDAVNFDYAIQGFKSMSYTKKELDTICATINRATKSAKTMAREVERLFAYYRLVEGPYEGRVISVEADAVQIYVEELGIDELIATKDTYHLLDRVPVAIKKNDALFFMERKFDMQIVPVSE